MDKDTASDEPLLQTCPACGAAMDVSDLEPLAAVTCPECGSPSVIPATIDHFELVAVIGHGGMGAVYKAHDTSLDRSVALKLLRKSSGSPEQIKQLETEAAITASINHPHVVRVFSTGMDHGRFYIAMELVEKGTLDSLIDLQGRVAEAQVLEVGIQIASGLRAAQHAGLIHRDVKPGNILFADSHTSKIVDFGLAIFAEDEAKTRGEIWGTPYYVAPEKLDQKPEDFRSDIYSLGGTLFHALAGRPPFEAENASLVALKHLKSQAVSLQAFAPHISGNTAYVINRTLAKDPDQRYQSYDELIEHLEYAKAELAANGGKPQETKRVVLETAKDKQAMGWVVVALMAIVIGLGVALFVFRDRFSSGDDNVTLVDAATMRKMLAVPVEKFGDDHPAEAADALAKIAAQKLPQPQLNWADMIQGLAQLAASRREEASETFKRVEERGPISKKDVDKPLAAFFIETSQKMQGDNPIDPASIKAVNNAGFESISLLFYGVKDWELGKFEDAAEFFKRFRQANPIGRDEWIDQFKPISSNYLDQYSTFKSAVDKLKNAKNTEEKKAAIATLKEVKGKFAPKAQELLAKAAADAAKAEKERAAALAQGKVMDGRYKLINRKTGKAMEVEGKGKEDGRKIVQGAFNGQPNAVWGMSAQGGGYFVIVNAESFKALAVPKAQTDELVAIVQGSITKSPSQKWKIEKAEGEFFKLTAEISGKSLTAVDAGGGIVQKTYAGEPEQQWKIQLP